MSWQHQTSAIVSGFIGDWLEAQGNPLALPMTFQSLGVKVPEASPAAAVADPKATLIVLIHGLMELDSVWQFSGQPDANYGTRVGDELATGASTLCLRYNTGRPIHANGQTLADGLERLLGSWPVPVERLILMGHSMGGLVIRSACHAGVGSGHRWVRALQDCVYIGSPHDGSWLAKGAQASARILKALPRDYLRVAGEVIDLRSDGIRNLTRGDILAGEGELAGLVPDVRHYVVCGLLGRKNNPVNALFGDALVHQSSARGERQGGWNLAGEASFEGIDHIRLAHHGAVAEQIVEWLV
ncbi:esterase/lipase family protein [Marinobacter mobilis]|uniref:PGAP1-like protein n=1 Tax=Marinobacter mobilis TaxID=488533 RepID=A0A1H2PXQ4_9GAMM|nr:hypothetical protein [Marinobacter mobilis]SDV99591.1 hypothetical protein SAMN04487960_1019 [Marinobacter mobilis]